MPLEVLIASPSGPLGELIRLTLEADQAFHCTLIDDGEDIRTAIRSSSYKAVVYDCSFSQPGPDEVAQIVRNEYPKQALLFIPSESNPDIVHLLNLLADGIISRPFDAALLPELINNAVQKRAANPTSVESSSSILYPQSRVNTLEEAIVETSASSGLIIKNRAIEIATKGINTELQDQVVSAILRYWNPADTSDLMRYIKDPVTDQDWMMYATQITNYRVLVLLFQKQTPVSLVRIQTLQLARQFAKNQAFSFPTLQPDENITEYQEPLNLEAIVGNSTENGTPNSSKSFPVEWFKEFDLPKSSSNSDNNEEPDQESDIPVTQIASEIGEEEVPVLIHQSSEQFKSPKDIAVKTFDFTDFEPLTPDEDIPVESPTSNLENEKQAVDGMGTQESETKQSVSLSQTSPINLDLGSFQPVDLIAESPGAPGLDSLQPVTLNSGAVPVIPEENEAAIEIYEKNQSAEFKPFEIADMPFSETDIPLEQPEGTDKTPEEHWPDFSSEESGIQAEQDEFSEKNALGKSIPEDLTEIPDFENLPFFMSATKQEPPTFDYEIFKSDDMDSVLSPSGRYEAQPDGESFMENKPPDEERNNSQPDQPDHWPESTEKPEFPESGTNSDLFARMNQLQSASKNEETETITVAFIPWQESFILHRQIASSLNQRMNKLCQAFGWKLENLTIRPTYMQFTVTITNLFSPEDMVGIVRQQTSQALNENLPDLQLPPNLEDIWAPESMMAMGKEFVPSNHWQNFINRRKTDEIA